MDKVENITYGYVNERAGLISHVSFVPVCAWLSVSKQNIHL